MKSTLVFCGNGIEKAPFDNYFIVIRYIGEGGIANLMENQIEKLLNRYPRRIPERIRAAPGTAGARTGEAGGAVRRGRCAARGTAAARAAGDFTALPSRFYQRVLQ